MTDLSGLCDDLAAEHAALDTLVAQLDAATWDTPTPAAGWLVRDQLSHLALYDGKARLAVVDPERFRSEAAHYVQGQLEQEHLAQGRRLTGDALLAWWREERTASVEAFRTLNRETRLPWYGPTMGAATFITARLMETWSHGHDIADALGLTLPATARLRHIAHLGVRTRAFSYTLRGLPPPTSDVFVDLASPDGDHWTWGDQHAADRLTGTARDFCLVVTQRRHPADTDLIATGALAHEWLPLAQAFAGQPGTGRPPGLFPRLGNLPASPGTRE